VGAVSIPAPFYDRLRAAPLVVLDVPRALRVQKLAVEYGRQDPQLLALAVMRIGKRLGGLATKEALGAIVTGEMDKMVELVLDYYDKTYQFGLSRRAAQITLVPTDTLDADVNADRVLAAVGSSGWPAPTAL
jgi:tRNA 2-selenouridine synthase